MSKNQSDCNLGLTEEQVEAIKRITPWNSMRVALVVLAAGASAIGAWKLFEYRVNALETRASLIEKRAEELDKNRQTDRETVITMKEQLSTMSKQISGIYKHLKVTE